MVLIVILSLAAIVVIAIGGRQLSLSSNKYFAPQERALDSKVFKESEQYNDSMIRDLENFRLQYAGANEDQKALIKSTIQHRYAVYNNSNISYELRDFLNKMKE